MYIEGQLIAEFGYQYTWLAGRVSDRKLIKHVGIVFMQVRNN